MVVGDVLVVERHDVGGRCQRHQGVEVVRLPGQELGTGPDGRVGVVGGEHMELDPEGDGRLLGHPGQLAAADHADHGGRRDGPGR